MQSNFLTTPLRRTLACMAGTLALSTQVFAVVTFDFETAGQLAGSSYASGNLSNFIDSTAFAQSGTKSMEFDYSTPDPYQSFTYDIPADTIETDGTISVWFYDTLGDDRTFDKVGGAIILEDKNDPANFLAVEIWNAPYPGAEPVKNYYITHGTAPSSSTFRSAYFGDRSIGWHEVVFTVTGASSTAKVDGNENLSGAGIITGPGAGVSASSNLRLRIMAGTPSVGGGGGNYRTIPTPTPPALAAATNYIYFDDITITETVTGSATHANGFETGEYDTPSVFMGPPANDNVNMKNFHNQWGIDTANHHGGANSAHFLNDDPVLKSVLFDLTTASAGTAALSFYDSLGGDTTFYKVGGSIVIEQISNPANFIAVEVWNAPYPSSDLTPGNKNYYLTKGSSSAATVFKSNYFGDRTVGWQSVSIVLTATTSKIVLNGLENVDNAGVVTGPGINDGIRLRIMADSPSCGGFGNWAATGADELDYLYLIKSAPYLYFDDISLPISTAGITDWVVFE